MEIVGLSGYARSGKDEAAKVLIEEFGFIRVAFADKLRDFLYALNPPVRGTIIADDGSKFLYHSEVKKVIDEYGWDGYKESMYRDHLRLMLQRLGTEAGRQTLWDSIWIDAALTGLSEDARVVVTDCRFPNEAQAITERGGKVWRIERTGVGPARGTDGSIHPSETSLDDWAFDAWIGNTGSLEDYHNAVRAAYDWTLGDKA